MKDTHQPWFKDAKYGLFIHWGLYCVLAGEYNGKVTDHIAEWILNDLNIPVEEYRRLAAHFNPTKFDADELVRRAKEDWGMRYIVLTAKHHEGFAMYHSAVSAYNVVDATPCGRDILGELSAACQKYGMRLGFYYSQSQDWDDPNGYMANRDNEGKDFQKYFDEKCKPQVRELLTGYGKISLIWFDTPMGITVAQTQDLIDLCRELQSECLLSGRTGNHMGDYMTTGDNFIPRLPFDGDWEVPATVNDTWGYSKHDTNWKSADDILHLMLKIVSRGGNYLLNVGPTAEGIVPEACVKVLDEVGAYLKQNGEAIYGTRALEVYPYDIPGIELTGRTHKLYIHVLKPMNRVHLLNVGNEVLKATLLRDGTELPLSCGKTCEGDSHITVRLPMALRKDKNYCIALDLKEEKPIFEEIKD